MTIPKLMHCIWIWPLKPPMYRIDSRKKKHPTRTYKLWDNKDLLNTNRKNQKAIQHYIATEQRAGVADIMRYEILYKYWWAMHWADSLCLNPIDELFYDDYTAYVVDTSKREWYELNPRNKNSVAPLYACTKHNKVAKLLIDEIYNHKWARLKPTTSTGNRLMQQVINKYNLENDICYRKQHLFIPKHFDWRVYKWKDKVFATHFRWTTKNTYEQWLQKNYTKKNKR